jgi:putative endonuclease
MAKWFVYLLECRDGSLYCGATNNIDKRVSAHSAGHGSKYTRSRLPVEMVYVEEVGSKSDALRREAAVKRLKRWQKLALFRP